MPPPPIPTPPPRPGKPVAAAVAGLLVFGLLVLLLSISGRRAEQPAGDKPADGAIPGGIPGGIQVHQARQQAPAKVLPRYAPDWTHRELVAYLEAKGVKVATAPASPHKTLFFYPPDAKRAANLIDVYGDNPGAIRFLADAGVILVTLYPTEQEAKEQAALGETSFSWHRFVFRGQAGYLKRYRDALAN